MRDPKFIDVDGIKTRYFEAGKGEPLVFIHGGHFGSYYNAYHWNLNFDDLSSHFHVYALDKIGQGHTDNPKSDAGYTMTNTIEHVCQFVRVAGIQRAVLMGHSRGALPAARIACDHPELVKAVVLVDTNTLAADHPSTPTNFYAKLDENPPPAPNEEFVRREPEANSYSKAHITRDFVEQMLSIARLPKIQEARTRMEHLLQRQFVPDAKKKKYETLDMIRDGRLKAPTLVLWGLNDPSAPVILGHQLFQHVAYAVPRAQFHVFNRAGHYVFREHARELDRVIVDFVRGGSD
ncbi:MAG: alpha/beta hydrolase [Deltaproteobacteria bacterium]|nr:alpha/beta hydrolase [Deltaproteobacteria bacterium]